MKGYMSESGFVELVKHLDDVRVGQAITQTDAGWGWVPENCNYREYAPPTKPIMIPITERVVEWLDIRAVPPIWRFQKVLLDRDGKNWGAVWKRVA